MPLGWRKPHGIDSFFRRRMRGYPDIVNIGYGCDKKSRHVLPNGFKKFLIRNVQDVELLLMNNRTYCGEISRTLGKRKVDAIIRRAQELNVRLTNGGQSRLLKEKEEQ